MSDISKGILFSAPMVRAILEGRKTQTRRVIKPQPPNNIPSDYYFDQYNKGENWNFWTVDNKMVNSIQGDRKNSCQWKCPFPEETILYVKETFCTSWDEEQTSWRPIYRADDKIVVDENGLTKWKPSIFMPRKFSRIWLQVDSVKVERLQEISQEDAKAEGAGGDFVSESSPYWLERINGPYHDDSLPEGSHDYKARFSRLWECINGKNSWNINPWVWVYKFRNL